MVKRRVNIDQYFKKQCLEPSLSDRDVLEQNMAALILRVRLDPPGDGSCFFHSVLDQCERLGIQLYPPSLTRPERAIKTRRSALDFVNDLVGEIVFVLIRVECVVRQFVVTHVADAML